MGSRYKGSRLAQVEALLRDRGPMTALRIAEELDYPTDRITITIQAARARRPGNSFRITRYEPQVGRWLRDQPVWSASRGQDVEHRPADVAARAVAYQQRYRERNRARRQVSMVTRNAVRRGTETARNPYLQLVPAQYRGYLAAAANTSMAVAA